MTSNPPVSWSRLMLAYLQANGRPVPSTEMLAVAESVTNASQAAIGIATDRLRAGQINVEEFRTAMQAAIKAGHGAEMVLARGGFDEIRPADWARLSEKVATQFDYLDKHVERIVDGVYGPGGQSSAFNVHSNAYADTMRSTYHNERLELHKEQGYDECKRLLAGGVDHCEECLELAERGWMPLEEMVEIGQCQCRQNCQCSPIYRRV